MIGLITTFDSRSLELLPEFVQHYKQAKVDLFFISVHIKPGTPNEQRDDIIARVNEILSNFGERLYDIFDDDYDSFRLRRFQENIRQKIENDVDWVVWADADELHEYQSALTDVVRKLDATGFRALGGRLVDRLPRDGKPMGESLWARFPLGSNLTEKILGGWVQKIALARSRLSVSVGHHYVAKQDGEIDLSLPVIYSVPVHHFKWDNKVVDRLRDRLEDDWKKRCFWWTESERAIQWVRGDGSIPLDGLSVYDFQDDLYPDNAGPFSKNINYNGGPYWVPLLDRQHYALDHERRAFDYHPSSDMGIRRAEQVDIQALLGARAGANFSPDCYVAPTAAILTRKLTMGNRSAIAADAILRGDISIGDETYVDARAEIYGRVTIGNHVRIGAGSRINANSPGNGVSDVHIYGNKIESKGISIGNNVWIGVNVVITNRVRIGDNCTIRDGAVVTRSLLDGQIAEGNPARVVYAALRKDNAKSQVKKFNRSVARRIKNAFSINRKSHSRD